MIHRFGAFELDEAKRELRLRGSEVPVQPRVFDVLVYLVTHRERVVSKRELLDAVWADAVVSDGSLKRAVSLARSALRAGGLEDSLRSYARQGYRFDCDAMPAAGDEEGTTAAGVLARAHDAYDQGAFAQAAALFAEADGQVGLGGGRARALGKVTAAVGERRRRRGAPGAGRRRARHRG